MIIEEWKDLQLDPLQILAQKEFGFGASQ